MSNPTLLSEGLIKSLTAEFYARKRRGEKLTVTLHALLHTVYAQGVVAGAAAERRSHDEKATK